MMRLFVVTVFVLFSVVPSFGQDVRVLPFDDVFQDLEVVQDGGDLVISRGGRGLHDYTVTNISRGTLGIKFMYQIASDTDTSLYLVTTDFGRKVSVRYGTDTFSRNATVRIMFFCNGVEDAICRGKLQGLLNQGIQLQSLGVSNLENLKSLPEGEMIFAFRMTSTGKFSW